jgi:copper(I)-binding protein
MRSKFAVALSLVAAMTISLGITPAATAATNDVVVTRAWVRSATNADQAMMMTGVFAKITNRTSKTVTLTGGTTSFAGVVEVHQVVDGVMAKKNGGIKIAPGKSVMLQPGGLHVMLLNLKKKILPGTLVDLKLTFTGTFGTAKSKVVTIKNLIGKISAAGGESYSPSPMPMPSMSATK